MVNTLDFSVLTATPATVTTEEKALLLQAISNIIKCSHVARKEGLLALEEFANEEVPEEPYVNKFFKEAAILVCDGTDPDYLETMLSREILIARPNSFEGYLCYITMKGILDVQLGTNPYILRESLIRLIPISARQELREELRKLEENIDNEINTKRLDDIQRLFPRCTNNPFVPVFEDRIKALTDKQVERALREIDNRQLAIVLSFVSAEIREKFFRNVSERLRGMIAEDMSFYDEAELTASIERILYILNKLEEMGEL